GRLENIQPGDYVWRAIHEGQGFKDGRKGTALNPDYCSGEFKRICAIAGLDTQRFSVHSLRHSSAHERLLSGESLQSISEILGHSSIAITATYLVFLAGQEDTGAAAMEQRLPFLTPR